MRILHVVQSVGRTSGGLGPVALGLARAQRDLGHDPEIWCLDYGDGALEAAEAEGLQDAIRVWPVTGPRFLGLSLSLQRALLDPSARFDIVHQHGIWLALSHATALCRSRRGWPTVVAPHGSLDPFALKRSRWKKWLALRAYESRNLQTVSCLHALSSAEEADIRAFGLKGQIAIIPNGISTEWLDSQGDREGFIRRFDLPPDRRLLLFLSRIHPKKGLPMLLEALHGLGERFTRAWNLVVAGPDEVGHRAELEKLARGLGIDRCVRFIGPVYGESKRDAFAAADLFVLPSHSEGAPMVILESLGTGTPVLATHASPWEELLTHSCGWWVETSKEAMCLALRDSLATPKEELLMKGGRGKALVADKYAWKAIAHKSVELYSELASRASPHGQTISSGSR